MKTLELSESQRVDSIQPVSSDFPLYNGRVVHIHPLATEDLLFFKDFREKLAMAEEQGIVARFARAQRKLTMIPPIPRSHPRWGDQLTLVADLREATRHHRTILAVAQLYPCAWMLQPYHAEAIVQIEPGSRDQGLETELIRRLRELACHIGIRTMDIYVAPEYTELSTLCHKRGYVPEFMESVPDGPTIWRLDVAGNE